jgi:hypothetical protein
MVVWRGHGPAGVSAARPLLLGSDGSRAYTLEPPDVITWCRW